MKNRFGWMALVCMVLGVVCALPAIGGEEMDAAAMEKMMAAIAPGPHHEHLKSAAGKWKAEGKMWEGPGEPKSFGGDATFELVLGGRYVEGVFIGEFNGMPFEGHSIDGFDKNTGKHFSIWIDNFGTGFMASEGTCSDDHKTVTTVGETFDVMSGKVIKMKSVSETIDQDQMLFTMYVLEGGQEIKVMEMRYTRI